MSSYSYVDAPNDNLICCICRTPFVEPLKTRTCGHTFCKECIHTALGVSSLCPIDRWPLVVNDLTPADPLVRNLVDELVVFCPNREVGCSVTVQRQLLSSHLGESCLFAEVECEDGLCDRKAPRKAAKHALHVDGLVFSAQTGSIDGLKVNESRPTATWKCSACMVEINIFDQRGHELSCLLMPVSCLHASNGCSWKGTRGDLSTSHLSRCNYEAIKGFLEVFSTKTQGLADENALLRRKVVALEGTVEALTAENEDVKQALGPWFRPHTHGDISFASTSRYTTEMVPGHSDRLTRRPVRHTRGSSSQLESTTSSNMPSNGPVHDGVPSEAYNAINTTVSSAPRPAAESSDLASYFPSVDVGGTVLEQDEMWNTGDDVLLSSPYATTSSVDAHYSEYARSPSSHPPQMYPDLYGYGQPPPPLAGQGPPPMSTSPPHAPIVAPLNLGTSLHRTLLSLRESIVTLSTAVDSLARRQDVGLAAEAMRMNEEIRSLRVVIHGLRMQMHSIMMDRNTQVVSASSAPHPPGPLPLGQTGAAGWLNLPAGPLPFAGPRFPSHAHPQNQSSSVSGPKL